MTTLLRKLWSEEEGQTLVEYALIIALVAIAAIAALQYTGGQVKTKFSDVSNSMEGAQ